MLYGFDVGGTKIELICINSSGEVKFKHRLPTGSSYDEFLVNMKALMDLALLDTLPPQSIGIGIAGCEDPNTGKIKNCNATFINHKPLSADLYALFKHEVHIENDANCFALSEAVDGSASGCGVVFGIILGTGCGGGLIVNQKIITGLNSNGGEWGHNPLPHYNVEHDGQGGVCFCGSDNCLEKFISGTGISRQYTELTQEHKDTYAILSTLDHDDNAALIYQRFLDQLGRSLATVINIIDPDCIVVGGGVSNFSPLYDDVLPFIRKYTITSDVIINIKKARHGDSSGVRGAAWLGFKALTESEV